MDEWARDPHELSSKDSDAEIDPQLLVELQKVFRKTGSAASNPALLRVSYLRSALALRRDYVPQIGLLALAVVLTFLVHWMFTIPAAVVAYRHLQIWKRTKTYFIAGCVNPAKVVSVDPPLVAAYTDLSCGGTSCPVIQISVQQLSRMSSGLPEQGQRVATVACYSRAYPQGDHWAGFAPLVADIFTANQADLDRVFRSIEKLEPETWDALETGLEQVPRPFFPGTYRIYSPQEVQERVPVEPDEIAELVEEHLSGLKGYTCATAATQIPLEMLYEAKTYAKTETREILAVIRFVRPTKETGNGLTITRQGVFYSIPGTGEGFFSWDEFLGAFLEETEFELTLRSWQRLRISRRHLLNHVAFSLELLFNEIVGA